MNSAHKHYYDESLTCRWCGHSIKLNGAWPTSTWFQQRLAVIRIKTAIEGPGVTVGEGKGETQ